MLKQNRIQTRGSESDERPEPEGGIVDEDRWQRGAERILDLGNRLMPASVTAVPGGLSGMGEVQQQEAEVYLQRPAWRRRVTPESFGAFLTSYPNAMSVLERFEQDLSNWFDLTVQFHSQKGIADRHQLLEP